jgi:hypothetical protein
MCHGHPEWTSINRDSQGRGHTPKAGRLREETPAQRHFWDACARFVTGRRTPPQAGKKDEINGDSVNRTRVRAKMRVAEIRKYSRREMKKAS